MADKGHSRTKSEITPQYHETRQQMGDSRHNFTIHATIPRFTPQFHDSRHNFTIHATISRFTPQFHDSHHKEADSHHKETADRPRSQY